LPIYRPGRLSHLNGSAGAYNSDAGSLDYLNPIKEWFDVMLGPISPHPFDLPLSPEPERYFADRSRLRRARSLRVT
jgi:hypothetical protein